MLVFERCPSGEAAPIKGEWWWCSNPPGKTGRILELRAKMNRHDPKSDPTAHREPPSLLDRWLNENPALLRYGSRENWERFFRKVVLYLKPASCGMPRPTLPVGSGLRGFSGAQGLWIALLTLQKHLQHYFEHLPQMTSSTSREWMERCRELFAGLAEDLTGQTRLASVRWLSDVQRMRRCADRQAVLKHLISLALRSFSDVRAVALLVRTSRGYRYGGGSGYQSSLLKGKILSPAAAGRQLPLINGSTAPTSIMKEIETHLHKARIGVEEGTLPPSLMVQLIPQGKQVYGLLQVCGKPRRKSFGKDEQRVLSFLCEEAGTALTRLQLQQQLDEMRLTYSAMLENSPLSVLIIQDDQIQLHNSALLELLTVSAGKLTREGIWPHVHPEDLSLLREHLTALQGRPGVWEGAFRIRRSDGEEVWCRGKFQQIQYQGRPAVMGELLNINDLRRAEEQLLLAQRMETLGIMAAGVAHDFNNILGTILPGAQLILREARSAAVKKHARVILQLARRASGLVGQLRSYARLSPAEAEPVNLNSLLIGARQVLQKVVGPAIKLIYSLHGELPYVEGDRKQLMQMMINLLASARTALKGRGVIQISTAMKEIRRGSRISETIKPGKYVVIRMHENRAMPDPAVARQLFAPLGDDDKGGPGKDPNLRVVYAILRKHCGYITLLSQAEKGTVFQILLPASQRAVELPASTGKTRLAGGSGTVLVVDDEKTLREVLVSMLKLLGYRCLEAAGGREALDILQAHPSVNLSVIDYALPENDGLAVFREMLKTNPRLKGLICSGYLLREEFMEMEIQEKVLFLPKPFTIEVLAERMNRLAAMGGDTAQDAHVADSGGSS